MQLGRLIAGALLSTFGRPDRKQSNAGHVRRLTLIRPILPVAGYSGPVVGNSSPAAATGPIFDFFASASTRASVGKGKSRPFLILQPCRTRHGTTGLSFRPFPD